MFSVHSWSLFKRKNNPNTPSYKIRRSPYVVWLTLLFLDDDDDKRGRRRSKTVFVVARRHRRPMLRRQRDDHHSGWVPPADCDIFLIRRFIIKNSLTWFCKSMSTSLGVKTMFFLNGFKICFIEIGFIIDYEWLNSMTWIWLVDSSVM